MYTNQRSKLVTTTPTNDGGGDTAEEEELYLYCRTLSIRIRISEVY